MTLCPEVGGNATKPIDERCHLSSPIDGCDREMSLEQELGNE